MKNLRGDLNPKIVVGVVGNIYDKLGIDLSINVDLKVCEGTVHIVDRIIRDNFYNMYLV